MNYFQYVYVPLIELINEKVSSFATDLSIIPLKLLLTISAVRPTGLILCIAKFIDKRKWRCSHTDVEKIYIICI